MVIKIHNQPPVPDYKIINAIRESASPAFQARVPKATQANVQDAIQKLLSNVPTRNEFFGQLMNRIGRIIGRNDSWSNPMAKFKIGMLEHGDTIEEVMTGLIKARVYDVNRDYMEKDLFAQERPEVQASFHKENRRNQYKFTVNQNELNKAFLPGDDYSLTTFISQIMASATKSDNLDEYLLMMRLFRENYDNGGFFKVQVPDVRSLSSDKDDANGLLRMIRTYSNTLKFLSTRYNAAKMPVAADPDQLELFLPIESDAALDVESLAGVFNLDRADVHSRKSVMPYEDFNIPGLQAVLTTRDFFVVADTHYEVNEMQNPAGRYKNYWLQHDQIISMSRFAPTILFTTEPGEPIVINDSTPTDISEVRVIDADDNEVTEVTRGEGYRLETDVTLDNEDGINDAVRYEFAGKVSYDTTINNIGYIRIGEQETAEEITINAYAVGDNLVSSVTVKVVDGDRLQLWPDPQIVEDGETDPDPED